MDPAVSGDKGAWRRRSDAAVSGADPICPRSKQAMELPPDDLIVFDEAHRSRGRTREHLISFYPDAMLLGMPATPFRGDGRGLGNLFDTMVETPQVAELIKQGHLVPSRVYAPIDPYLRANSQPRARRGAPNSNISSHAFRHAPFAQSAGTRFLGCCFRLTLSPHSLTGAACTDKGVHDASFDAVHRCDLDHCDGIFLRPCGERSGPIAFAQSLPGAAKYPGPKTRRSSSGHRARGYPQGGLSPADRRGCSRKEQLLDEAVNAIEKAVTDQGLSVEEYDSILKVAQNDPEVRDKIRQRIRPSAQ
jgi:hypothetical protein